MFVYTDTYVQYAPGFCLAVESLTSGHLVDQSDQSNDNVFFP